MDANQAKRVAAEAACAYVEDGMTVGLGTGSTADFAVKKLGERVREGLRLRAVPTSLRTMELAEQVGIPLADLDEVERFDVTIDGADEVDPHLDLVKGLGGALLREKIVASMTDTLVIVVDPSKLVPRLGTRSPLPVEVLPFGASAVARRLRGMGLDPRLREKDGQPVRTDNGHLVLDVRFHHGIDDPRALEARLNNIPGVVENGLFLGMARRVLVGEPDGTAREIAK